MPYEIYHGKSGRAWKKMRLRRIFLYIPVSNFFSTFPMTRGNRLIPVPAKENQETENSRHQPFG